MTVRLTFPEDNDPSSYDRLDGEWRQWYETAHRFEHKVPAQDRGDIRHNIILELAQFLLGQETETSLSVRL